MSSSCGSDVCLSSPEFSLLFRVYSVDLVNIFLLNSAKASLTLLAISSFIRSRMSALIPWSLLFHVLRNRRYAS